ncbi:DsbA family oxidoreductase [Lactobacillus ultunensis]|uniref:DsbA-like protein n=1 Tax=Lactobacillus ultunensis DSM 16047 TaxID=525365 RepID=C2ER63_9LACO|nr:DsbA family oxidoreductase [Lactobacillus ultunensis]EEJ70952.1 DsbA-like protein [Lactobacillus ultunensis DSM 16047]KRL79744.1 protein-disulfide isomerase [Lactobacillus ultunensis DSM 16047]QQP28975.1 DsbA family oxidoreductase [Lactobacillus ultunensis]
MEIKYWSDIACPFCYIGSTRMKKAMKEVGIYDDTKLKLKSFELNPMEKKTAKAGDYINHFTGGRKDLEVQAKKQMDYITQMAAEEGLEFHLDKVVPTNTGDAHRLIKLAESKSNRDLTEKLIARLYKVYFTDGESIADHDVLTKAAVEVGMDKDEVKHLLNSSKYQKEVVADELEAQQSGITAAPFFVINNKYGISGAQPYEVFVKALKQVKEEENV